MLRARLPEPGVEEGSSMVEVMVGMAMGMVVLAGLSMLLIVTLHGNARISARAEASDNARVTMTRVIEQLHSACVNPTEPPVKAGSYEDKLIFTRGTYGGAAAAGAAPIPVELTYSPVAHTLSESVSGGKPRILLSNVSTASGKPIFSYENPTSSPSRFEGKLGSKEAEYTIQVRVAFKASPKSEPVKDAGAATEIENSVVLRLTPPTYEGKVAKPCE
jgi:Tfp pilus assembly protein PilW